MKNNQYKIFNCAYSREYILFVEIVITKWLQERHLMHVETDIMFGDLDIDYLVNTITYISS